MAKILRGPQDDHVQALKSALEAYEQQFAGSQAALYRQNPADIRIRIIDDRFAGMNRSRRHDDVWERLLQAVGEDTMSEVSALLLLPTGEVHASLANLEFEDPLPSRL